MGDGASSPRLEAGGAKAPAVDNVLRRVWRKTPIDLVAFVVIGLAMIVTHRSYIRHGMCFNDPSWYFHFGHRALAGDVPYRDYVFQVGPLPVYVDAVFQKLYGGIYLASLYASLLIKILRVFIIWMIARRIVGVRAAIALSVFCALDPLFGFAHHWSTAYAHMFMTLSGLCFVQASRTGGQPERRTRVYLVLAGLCASLVVSARQSSAVMIGIVLLAATGILALRKEYFTRQRVLALGSGFALGFVLVFGTLAIFGALGPAIQQMFLDGPQKKGIHGIDAILDAISGGALVVGGDTSWWGGCLLFLGFPTLIVIAIVLLASRDRALTVGSVGVVVIPLAMFVGLLTRYAQLNLFSDLPRTFLTVTTGVAVVFPRRIRTWFGLEPLVAIGLGALPLASDWALEMSYPGRGWGDAPALVVGAILLALASSHLSPRAKTTFCTMLAIVAITGTLAMLKADVNPFVKDTAQDGLLLENSDSSKNRRLRAMWINEARRDALAWLTSSVPAHSTCFIYGNLPVLYTLLTCQNPTRIDSTAADFITERDALAAVEALRAHPPDYLIAHEKSWMNPPLTLDLHDDVTQYDGLNPRASRAIHMGLRSILDRYESIGVASEVIGPELVKLADKGWDLIGATRVYRRKAGGSISPPDR